MNYSCIDIYKIDRKHKVGNSLCVDVGGESFVVKLSEQKTGFGCRKFFVCPECDRRTVRLYRRAGTLFLCDKCAGINLYRPIQNGTKGGDSELAYRMERFAIKHDIRFDYPFDYKQFDHDPRCGKPAFRRALHILQGLENMRLQNIVFKTIYSQKTIRAVLTGKHPILKEKSLYELQRWLWRF